MAPGHHATCASGITVAPRRPGLTVEVEFSDRRSVHLVVDPELLTYEPMGLLSVWLTFDALGGAGREGCPDAEEVPG